MTYKAEERARGGVKRDKIDPSFNKRINYTRLNLLEDSKSSIHDSRAASNYSHKTSRGPCGPSIPHALSAIILL